MQIQPKDKIYYPANYKRMTEQEFQENVTRFAPQEVETARLLSIILNDSNYIFNQDKHFDINFLDKNIKIECKTDTLMNQTGNCFIETQYKYKPNGIYDTQANYICINDNNDNYYLIETCRLKKLIESKTEKDFKLVTKSLKGGYLIKKEELINNSIELNEISNKIINHELCNIF